ncbi:YbgA family protein [uncultured Granulicatella sp.]|uniref:YbgA family protein n=1 Tax=uncultured Granulicatella sp. TaxID=316089 RepID=UPI0028D0A8E2|nr:YbgA family protein [uncultured Granulicatella sp.]
MNQKEIRKQCQQIWARNKYYVLSKSHKVYLEIREYLKEPELDLNVLLQKINTVKELKESKKDFHNAILHVWGYFKNIAEKVEKDELFRLLEEYRTGVTDQSSIINYIHTLLEKYPNHYLQQSTLITGEQDEIMA